MKITKLFLDTEFTGLHQRTTLISIGLVTEHGDSFYAELIDYDKDQLDDWLQTNIIDNLSLGHFQDNQISHDGNHIKLKSDKPALRKHLEMWLGSLGPVEVWSDCLAYDWVLFNDIFGHAFNIPKNVLYIPYDLSTLLRIYGYDSDISRIEFSESNEVRHNALGDAITIKLCFEKIMRIKAENFY